MFLEPGPANDWARYAFVVVGSGPAGLSLADTLGRYGRVLVLEAGGLDPLADGAGYYDIVATGRPHPPLGTRLSSFGGTSNHWGGHCHPLAPAIFENRKSNPGWPIAYRDYAAHLAAARSRLRLADFDDGGPNALNRGLLADYEGLGYIDFHFSHPILRLGDDASRTTFSQHPDVDVAIETRVIDLHLDPGGTRVASLEVLHRPTGQRWRVPARTLVLATGGIENARIMLWAGRKYAAGNPLLGGPNGLTGKYYHDHLYIDPVDIFLDDRIDTSGMFGESEGINPLRDPGWLVSDALLEEHDLPRFCVFPASAEPRGASDPDIHEMPAGYLQSSDSYIRLHTHFQFEQTPHAGSYVALNDALDVDGVARAELHWELLRRDTDGMRRGVQLFCGLLNQHGFARARLKPEYRIEDWADLDFRWNNHHMGTTRMGDSAVDGVVDRDCRVFGLANMFVAGSSVFPSGDLVNPTLSIVTLAERLARHLAATRATRLNFGVGEPANGALVAGWSDVEPQGVWTTGTEARLEIETPGVEGITIGGSAYRNVSGRLSVNGVELYAGQLADLAGRPFSFPSSDKLLIDIAVDNPASPLELGESADARKLGLFLQFVELR